MTAKPNLLVDTTGATSATPRSTSDRPGSGRIPGLLPAVSWLVVAVAAVAVSVAAGSAGSHALAYLVTWLLSTTLPGVLVWRALARPSSVVEEVGFGNVLGIALLLVAWVPAVTLGHAALAWAGPVAVVTAFLTVPRLRVHWRPQRVEPDRTPGSWHAAMSVVAVLGLGALLVKTLRSLPLPGTADTRVHPDMFFQLSLINQLQQTLAPEQPQAAGMSMHYHWFSNAYVAVTSAMSGVPSSTALMHLWLVGMTLTLLLAVAAVTRRLLDVPAELGSAAVRRWWLGPVAGLLAVVVPVVLVLGEPRLRNLGSGFQTVSTSGTLALVVVLAISGPVIDLVRGARGRGTWLLAVALLALSAGTKPSIPPVVIAALLLVGARHWLLTRAFPRAAAGLAVVTAGFMALAAVFVMGGDGAEVALFETLGLDTQMQVAETDSTVGILETVVALLLLYTLTELPRLLGLLGIGARKTRRDPAMWWCAGVVFAGLCASWIVSHPGYSQQYFWRIVISLGVVTTLVTAVRVVPDGAKPLRAVLLAAAPGILVGLWALSLPAADTESPDLGAFTRLIPYAVAGVVLAVTLATLRLPAVRRLVPGLPALTLVVVFTFAAGTPVAIADLREPVTLAVQGQPPAYSEREAPRLLTRQEQQGALWLRRHAGPDDRVVTNVFCVPTVYYPGCESTAFWVAGISGRSVVLGGWAYMEQTRANYVENSGGAGYKNQPPPFPERAQLSLDLVRNPSAEVVRRLRDEYDARWVLADRRSTAVSPNLADYADLRYRNRDVSVYELR